MKIYHYHGKCNASGANIRRLREQACMSQEQLSAQIQLNGIPISQKAISRIETGDRVVADYELLLFSKIFKVDVSALLEE